MRTINSCCLTPDVFEDFQTGDSICRNCGACCHDVMLDAFGNQPATYAHAFSFGENGIKGKVMREMLEQALQALDISDAFLESGFRMVDEVYSSGKSLQGTDLAHLCIAIAKRISDDNNLNFDSKKVEAAYGVKIMARVEKLTEQYLPCRQFKGLPNAVEDEVNSRKLKFQRFILKTANELEFEKPMLSKKLVDELCSVAKSTKVRSTVALYIMDPTKMKAICEHFKTSKEYVKTSLKEIERLVNVNYGVLQAEKQKAREAKERAKAECKARAKLEKAHAKSMLKAEKRKSKKREFQDISNVYLKNKNF